MIISIAKSQEFGFLMQISCSKGKKIESCDETYCWKGVTHPLSENPSSGKIQSKVENYWDLLVRIGVGYCMRKCENGGGSQVQ